MSNNIKPKTKQSIDELKEGNVVPVMATGDNLLTSISVSFKCNILTNEIYFSCEKNDHGEIRFMKQSGYSRMDEIYSNFENYSKMQDFADEDSNLLVSHIPSENDDTNTN